MSGHTLERVFRIGEHPPRAPEVADGVLTPGHSPTSAKLQIFSELAKGWRTTGRELTVNALTDFFFTKWLFG